MASSAAHPKSFEPGVVLDGRYRLESVLGEGGVGQVFRARHLQLGNDVAIKVLQTKFEAHSAMRPRFLREAQAMAALKHPHIIAITDFQTGSGPPYIVMELLDGLTLRETMEPGRLALPRARRVLEHLLDALSYAHDKGFVHRDLKPDNIFLLDLASDDAFPKILDFGFVKLTDDAQPVDSAGVLTRSGIAFGTPAYMSPEQATGAPAEARSDLYSLGIVFFEMLAGRRPYEGSLPEIVRKHLTAPVPTFTDAGAAVRGDDALRRFFLRAMAKEAKDRFSTAKEMKQALLALPKDCLRGASSVESSAKLWSVAPTVPAMTVRAKRDTSQARDDAAAVSRIRPWLIAAVLSVAGLAVLGAMYDGPEATPEESNRLEPPAQALASNDDHNGAAEEVDDEVSMVEAPEVVERREESLEQAVEVEPEDVAAETTLDPWEDAGPSWMRRARTRTQAGRTLSRRTEDALKRYVRAHRDDPRPHLLLAHSFAARGWDSSALERYALAQRVHSSASADPQMLSELVRLSARSTNPARAAAMVTSIYGENALDALDAALEVDDFDEPELDRLRRLQLSLR